MPKRPNLTQTAKGAGTLSAARQQTILMMTGNGEVVSIHDLAEQFGVSQETIRRDIRSLEEAGQLRRVHGGAAPMRTFDLTARRPIVDRLSVDRDVKKLAANAAMALFEDDMNVYLGASSTMLLVAEELALTGKKLTITTNMIDIAMVLAASGRCTVTLLGGIVNPQSRTLSGQELYKSLEQRLFDLTVLGASAIDPVHGVLSPTKAHNILASTLAAQSQRSAFVMDSFKFERRDAHVALRLDQLDFLATDSAPPAILAEALEAAGVAVLLPDTRASDLLQTSAENGIFNQ